MMKSEWQKLSPMCQQAILWIASNDEESCMDAHEMGGLISVALVSDLFNLKELAVADAVIWVREQDSNEEAKEEAWR